MIKDDRIKEDPKRSLFNGEKDLSDQIETPYWMQVAQAQAAQQVQEERERYLREQARHAR